MDFDAESVREALASAGGDEQQALHILRSAQEGRRISFRDHFAGTTESLPHDNIPLLPDEQAALVQVTRPLQLMRAAAWIIGRRWPAAGTKRLPQQPLPPLDCVRDGCAARVPARAMFGWVATACRRLASAPGDVLVSDRATWRVAGCVMERVSRGRVRRVQVQPQRRAAVSRHMCVCFVTGCCSKRWLTCRWRTAKRRSSMQRAAARRAFPPTRCLQCAVAASLGRYAAPGKHVVSAAPQPAAPTSALKRLAPDPPPHPPSYSATRASSTPAPPFATSMDRLTFQMAVRPLVLMPGLKLLQATPAMLKWRTRMRGEVGARYSATARRLALP